MTRCPRLLVLALRSTNLDRTASMRIEKLQCTRRPHADGNHSWPREGGGG